MANAQQHKGKLLPAGAIDNEDLAEFVDGKEVNPDPPRERDSMDIDTDS